MRKTLLFLSVLLAGTATAQDYWRPATGPFGGTIVHGIAATPEGFYAATVSGLFYSDDAGATWALENDGITASGIDSREVLRLADGSALLATYGGGVFKRWQGANGWQQMSTPDPWVQAITQAEDGTVYAGTIRGVLRSENSGSSWQIFSVDDRTLNIRDVAVDHNGVLYAATSEGVYKSPDRGVSWDWASGGMTTWDTDVLFVTSTGDVYAGTSPIRGGCTLFRTRNAGRIWTCVQPQTDPIRAGGMAEDEQGRLYFGGFRYVYRSDDEGSTWSPIAQTSTTVHGIAASGSTVIAGTYGRGVLRTGNRGTTWEASNTGLQSAIRDIAIGPNDGLFAATLGGVFLSRDQGSTWTLLDDLAESVKPAQSLAFDTDGRLLDGTLNGLFRYDLVEETWEALGPPGSPPVRDVLPGPNGELFVGYHEGVYHLRGQNWTSYPLIGPDQAARDVIAIGVDQAGTIFAGGTYDSFMRPGGQTGWVRLTSPATPYFEAQVFARSPDDRLYAGTRYFGVMRSSDGGQTWSPMTNGLSGSEDIRAIAFDPDGTMFMGSFGNGVYRLGRNGAWQPVTGGMENARRVTSLAFDASGNAYAGTYGSGIWVHDAGVTNTESPDVPVASVTLDVYPNPSSGVARARVELAHPGDVLVEVFDVMGRQVAMQREYLATGSHPGLGLPVDGLAAGLYAVRITTAEHSATRTLVLAD
ncbi:MAG: T9SS type A sorting domain-containing protein [Rhodothermales bacterium]|nr:T9SS type A sorting domain-containing protein [Rhodothermales bacterium]MBO6778763.1 T9SS type A sorting domain-containing protein [Rhodothermales bacterium]